MTLADYILEELPRARRGIFLPGSREMLTEVSVLERAAEILEQGISHSECTWLAGLGPGEFDLLCADIIQARQEDLNTACANKTRGVLREWQAVSAILG